MSPRPRAAAPGGNVGKPRPEASGKFSASNEADTPAPAPAWHGTGGTRPDRPTFDRDPGDVAGVILFDGRCRFCRWVVNSLLALDGRLRVCSVWSEGGRAAATALGRSPGEAFALLTPRGAFLEVEAYVALLSLNARTRPLARLLARAPAWLSGAIYRRVACHRALLSRAVPAGRATRIEPARFVPGGDEPRASPGT